jgi:hypothetical protein
MLGAAVAVTGGMANLDEAINLGNHFKSGQ